MPGMDRSANFSISVTQSSQGTLDISILEKPTLKTVSVFRHVSLID